MTAVLGIDIGGSGIKGAPISTTDGAALEERHRIATPQPATSGAIMDAVAELVEHFSWKGPVGIGFPGVVRDGVIFTAANLDKSCIGVSLASELGERTGCACTVINDADAAGMAEMRFGAGVGRSGVVMALTVGTGIGSALFSNGLLVPNTELGHMTLSNGKHAESFASDAVRKKRDLSWKEWAERFGVLLADLEFLFSPELFILGGGASKKFERFGDSLNVDAEVVPAKLRNMAGIVGAAAYAAECDARLQPA